MFITFEGPEGSGKSTQLRAVCAYLTQRQLPCVQTREPGGTRLSDLIRQLILSPAHTEMHATTEFLLFSASRAQHVQQFIRPHLQAGRIVMCDRYADSSLAYQGYGRGLDLNLLRQVTLFATGGLAPDLTFYLDVDVAEGLRRKQQENATFDRLDSQTLEFHERVRQGYLALAAQEPARWVLVDAAQPKEVVTAELCRRLDLVIRNS
jgi:dTMP kinase